MTAPSRKKQAGAAPCVECGALVLVDKHWQDLHQSSHEEPEEPT